MKIRATHRIIRNSVEEKWTEETMGFIVAFLPYDDELPGVIFISDKGEITYCNMGNLTVDMDEF